MVFTVPGQVFQGGGGVSVPDTPLPNVRRTTTPVNNVASGAVDPTPLLQGINSVADAAQFFADVEDDAAAKDADSRASDAIREIMRNPETGFLFTRGEASVKGREGTIGQLEQVLGSVTDGMSGRALAAATQSINARLDAAQNGVETHTGNERISWLAASSDARLETAKKDAIAGFAVDGEVGVALAVIASENRDRAERRGWSAEQLAAQQEADRSRTLAAVAMRRAEIDPVSALEWAESVDVGPVEMAALEAKLNPEVKRREGQALGDAAYGGALAPNGNKESSGPFNSQSYIAIAEGRESGGDATAENPNSSAGGAFQFIDSTWLGVMKAHFPEVARGKSEEQLLAMKTDASPEGVAFQRKMMGAFTNDNASALSRAGLPVTNTTMYMSHFFGSTGARKVWNAEPGTPIATIFPNDSKGSEGPGRGGANGIADIIDANPNLAGMTAAEAIEWAGGEQETRGAGKDPLAIASEIEDPDVRAAALTRVQQLQTIEAKGIAQQKKEAQDKGVRIILEGGGIDGIDIETKQIIGSAGINSLIALEKNLSGGNDIVTDFDDYYRLRLLAANEPEAFMDLDLFTDFRGTLSNGDFKRMTEIQATMIGADGKSSRAGNNVSFANVKSTINMMAPGVYDFTEKLDTTRGKASSGVYMAVTDDVEAFAEEQGRNPDAAEMRAIVQRQLAQTQFLDQGFFRVFDGVSSKPYFEVVDDARTSLEGGDSFSFGDDPELTLTPEIASEIAQGLQAAGQAIDFDNIVQVFLRAKGLL